MRAQRPLLRRGRVQREPIRLRCPALRDLKPRHHHTPTSGGEVADSRCITKPSQTTPTNLTDRHSPTLTNTGDHAHFAPTSSKPLVTVARRAPEGGPTLLDELVNADTVAEICLTLPQTRSGPAGGPSIAAVATSPRRSRCASSTCWFTTTSVLEASPLITTALPRGGSAAVIPADNRGGLSGRECPESPARRPQTEPGKSRHPATSGRCSTSRRTR